MRHICRYILILTLSFLICGCADDKVNFSIEGSLAGGETLTLRLTYYDGEKIVSQQIGARDGKFEIEGKVQGPTILELSSYDGSLLTNLFVDKKSHFKVRINVNKRAQIDISGDDINSRYASFLSKNDQALSSGDIPAINEAVAKYITDNPSDIASTMLLLTLYDSSGDDNQAFQLFESLDPEAKPISLVEPFTTLATRLWDEGDGVKVTPFDMVMLYDSIFHFDPSEKALNLLTFSTSNRTTQRKDSIVDSLKALHRTNKDIRIIDIAIESDTISWKRYTRTDSANWEQAWMPGGISARGIERLSIPTIPYFIIVDSTGVQRVRTRSLSKAVDTLRVIDSKDAKKSDKRSGDSQQDKDTKAKSNDDKSKSTPSTGKTTKKTSDKTSK